MHFLIFLGSVRDSTPPNPPRLGLRVARACYGHIVELDGSHSAEIVDPLEYELGAIFKPHFAYSRRQVPEDLDRLAKRIQQADGYVMVSPEYNHSMSPALAHLLNHFGSSLFSYKPSVIVTYSAGQWGGARAGVAMRTFLSELGCLPVSAMVQIPKARDVLEEDGTVSSGAEAHDWETYLDRTFQQLYWWAEATREQRRRVDPHKLARPFQRDPSQRNPPG